MGWAEELPSGRHRAMIRVHGRKRNATPGRTYGTAAEAKRVAGREEDSQRTPGALDPRSGRITWDEWCRTWWAERDVAASTALHDWSRVENHVSPRWGHVQLGAIDRAAVQAWVRKLEREGSSPGTIRRVVHMFSGSLSAAVLAGLIAANPCASVRLPRVLPGDERYLTTEEVERITFYLDEPWRSQVQLLAGTGMRYGELAALHWHRVQDDRIRVALAWDGKNKLYKLPKDHEQRDVPLLDWVEPVLAARRLAVPPGRRCGEPHPPELKQRCSSSLVLPGPDGRPVAGESFRYHWQVVVGSRGWRVRGGDVLPHRGRALAQDPHAVEVWVPGLAGIDEPARVHDLRHTFASWFLHAGGTLEELAPILGHSSVVITERYAHLAPDRHEQARQRMAGRGPRRDFAPHVPHVGSELGSNVEVLARRRRSRTA